MKTEHEKTSGFSALRSRKTSYWKDTDELLQVMHSLPGYFRALLLDLIDNPMTYDELFISLKKLEMRTTGKERIKLRKTDFKRDLETAAAFGVIEYKEEKYVLTPGGEEMARYINEIIPLFFNMLLSEKTVSFTTIFIHILLSILKLFFGYISRSAGLISDGIDNTVDTMSSVIAWFGIKYNKGRLASLFIIMMMIFSFIGIVITGIGKVINPLPVREGLAAFIVSGSAGIIMLMLSAYQYITGKKTANFTILCQSVDSRNHFLTSILVCAGIIISYFAEITGKRELLFSDAAAAFIISVLILKSSVELITEYIKPEDETAEVSHFIEKARVKNRKKIISQWLSVLLYDKGMKYGELSVEFKKQFCDHVPRIFLLTGIGYHPENSDELKQVLDVLVDEGRINFSAGKYSLPGAEQ